MPMAHRIRTPHPMPRNSRADMRTGSSMAEAVQGPESSDREDCGSLPGEIGASGRCLITGLVMEQNMTLPIVGPNAEDRIGEYQD